MEHAQVDEQHRIVGREVLMRRMSAGGVLIPVYQVLFVIILRRDLVLFPFHHVRGELVGVYDLIDWLRVLEEIRYLM